MTSELRPAVEVWTEAFRTWDREPGYVQAVYEAAAVIEADREAVRAEQAAEIERLRERLEIDPAHSIDGIYARDETIRGLDTEILKLKARDIGWSMQFEEQAEELAKFKALAETLAGALDDHLSSIVKRSTLLPGEKGNAVQLEVNLYKIADRAAALSEALRQYKEARDAS